VDGVITNYPNHVRQIMADRGMPLPTAYQPH
jgi:glycerophosphoryl diester phosphodiesterase